MSVIDSLNSVVERYGQAITYRRIGSSVYNATTGVNTPSTSDSTVKASIREYAPRDLAGLGIQGARKVIVPASSLGFSPKKGDQVIADGKTYTIDAVNARAVDDVIAVYIMRVVG